MGLGNVITSCKSDAQHKTNRKNAAVSGLKGWMGVVFHAIRILQKEQYDTFGIIDGSDQDIKVFLEARRYKIQSEFCYLPRGWAPHHNHGSMYGRKYIGSMCSMHGSRQVATSQDEDWTINNGRKALQRAQKYWYLHHTQFH